MAKEIEVPAGGKIEGVVTFSTSDAAFVPFKHFQEVERKSADLAKQVEKLRDDLCKSEQRFSGWLEWARETDKTVRNAERRVEVMRAALDNVDRTFRDNLHNGSQAEAILRARDDAHGLQAEAWQRERDSQQVLFDQLRAELKEANAKIERHKSVLDDLEITAKREVELIRELDEAKKENEKLSAVIANHRQWCKNVGPVCGEGECEQINKGVKGYD